MAERFIPKKTKVKMEFFKGVTLADIAVAALGVGGFFALALANFAYHWYLAIGWVALVATMFIPIDDGLRLYGSIGLLFRFMAFKKKYNKDDVDKKSGVSTMKTIIPFDGIFKERYINYKDYYAEVINVQPMEFGLLSDEKQEMVVNTFANALRRLNHDQTCSLVKLNKAIIFDSYIHNEDKKYDDLMELEYEGEMTEEEVQARAGVFEARVTNIEYMNREERIYKDYFYLVVYDKDREALDTTVDGMINTMGNAVVPMYGTKVTGRDLAVFLKANYGKMFDERDLESLSTERFADWAMPDSIVFKTTKTIVDKIGYRSFVVSDYPLKVGNGWGARFFLLDRTNVVMNFTPMQKNLAERKIDRAIIEMEGKAANTSKSSKIIENETHLKTLRELLQMLKNNNEQLFECNIHLCCEDGARKEVRAILKQCGFRYSEMFGRQVDAFVSRGISRLDTVNQFIRDIPTTVLASVFPFISGALQDENGFYLGYNEYPVFVNLFLRNRERVNSNVMIVGKSGSGKSFCTKTILTNLACDNTKIFILDPEDEYTKLAYNLKGKMLDVGSSLSGRFNPFHIIATLESEEGNSDDSYSTHLQFLEEFFSVILPDMPSEAFERLNSLVVDVYKKKNIGPETMLKDLTPEDMPVFDDLYALVKEKLATEKDEYHRRNYQTIETYISKFATGGRNSNLWNGPTSVATKENFVTFSFRSLLANRNEVIANAQMLLVFKYLDNEIIKNKDFNDKYSANRHIVVAVDEAHVFINPKHPIALDFMAQMAKRIRKYGGMQIVITQNIKDFVGSPEIERQSTAIINASQYSFILSLAPNDITDLVNLYRHAGGINKEEQDNIVTAGVGQAFLITGPMSRTSVKIEPSDIVKKLFS